MVGRAGVFLSQCEFVDRKIVSTDDPEIREVAGKYGLDAPFARPPELSGDRIGDYEVLLHGLVEIEKFDKIQYDLILMIQPTSPLRKKSHVEMVISKLLENCLDAVWTVSETDLKFHPFKQLSFTDDGKIHQFDGRGKEIVARQQLTPVYHRNGSAYVFTRDCLLNQKTIFPKNSSCVIVQNELVNIDTMEDLELANTRLREEQKKI